VRQYPYDGRGKGSVGSMTYRGDGRADLFFPQQAMDVPDLSVVPGFPVYVDIVPDDMAGTIDSCTGEVELFFEGVFRPLVFDRGLADLRVATTLTTGSSRGVFREVAGRTLDGKGDLLLVGVAPVPRTGDPLLDALFDLPTDAAGEIEAHLDFPEGRFACYGAPQPGMPEKVFMGVGRDGRLAISFLGSFAEFPYDGKGSDGIGKLEVIGDGRASVEFSEFHVPPLQFIPGFDDIRIEITPHRLSGFIDFCTGLVELDFDATFTPWLGNRSSTSISIVTTITTETSAGFSKTVTGERLDKWGDALLVGVAKVPPTGDPLIDGLLDLPNDAVCRLPVHIDVEGGGRAACR